MITYECQKKIPTKLEFCSVSLLLKEVKIKVFQNKRLFVINIPALSTKYYC